MEDWDNLAYPFTTFALRVRSGSVECVLRTASSSCFRPAAEPFNVFLAPLASLSLAGQEHGRTIPLADIGRHGSGRR